jgi:hypothetical protein
MIPMHAIRPIIVLIAAAGLGTAGCSFSYALAGPSSAAIAAGPTTMTSSRNWAGYVATGTSFRQVSAEFTVPSVNCARAAGRAAPGGVAFWAGLGGYHGVTLGQDGVAAVCILGKARYYAWHENLPAGEVKLPGFAVSPGDSVTASVSYDSAARTFTFRLVNDSTGQRGNWQGKCPPRKVCATSAEVITEPAQFAGKITQLADYGAVVYENIAVTDRAGARSGLISRHWATTEVAQQRNGSQIDVPGPARAGGRTFTTTWLRAS